MDIYLLGSVQSMRQAVIEIDVPLHLVPGGASPLVSGPWYSKEMASSLARIVAHRIEQAILAAGYKSQDQFANEIGMSRGTLSRVLSSAVDVRLSTIEKIAKGLGVSGHLLLLPDPIPGLPEPKNQLQSLRKPGRHVDPEIFVKIRIPYGVEPPPWLKAACERGEVEHAPKPVKTRKRASRSLAK